MFTRQLSRVPKRKGWKPDYTDDRDKPFGLVREIMEAVGIVPKDEDYEIDDSKVELFDQLNEASCVSNSWTATVETLQTLELGPAVAAVIKASTPPPPPAVAAAPPPTQEELVQLSQLTPLSRQFLYWTARCITNSQNTDGGTFLRSGCKALATTGICCEKDWPYDERKVLTSPPSAAFLQGSNNLLSAYYSIAKSGASRLADIETSIKTNHPVPFGTQVGQDLEDYEGSAADVNKIFDPPVTSAGGHALVVMGIRRVKGKRSWKIRNSWNRDWGLGGYAWFSDQYMTWAQTSDLWSATFMPQFTV